MADRRADNIAGPRVTPSNMDQPVVASTAGQPSGRIILASFAFRDEHLDLRANAGPTFGLCAALDDLEQPRVALGDNLRRNLCRQGGPPVCLAAVSTGR